MNGYGEAIAYGAATIINAIALGKGAAFGVDLWTKAKIILTEDIGVIKGKIMKTAMRKPLANTERRKDK